MRYCIIKTQKINEKNREIHRKFGVKKRFGKIFRIFCKNAFAIFVKCIILSTIKNDGCLAQR